LSRYRPLPQTNNVWPPNGRSLMPCGAITHATLMNFPSWSNRETSYKATRSVGSLFRARARTVRPIKVRFSPLFRVTAAMGESERAAPPGAIGNGGCQRPASMRGLAQVVPTPPSGPIQNTSSAPSNRVTAAIGELARAAPGGAIGNGVCQRPPSTRGLAQVVPTPPSGPIQNTSSAPSNRVTAAIGELARVARGGAIGKGACQRPSSMRGLAQVVPTPPSGPIQNTSRAPSSRVMAAIGELARAAPAGAIGKGGCQLPESTRGLAHVVPTPPSGPIQNA